MRASNLRIFFRLSLHELLAELEDDEPEGADIYMIPPEDGAETDQDSDKSDEEHEANPNHLGPATLRSECEAVIFRRQPAEADWDSEDDLPLSNFVQKNSSGTEPKLKRAKTVKSKNTSQKKTDPDSEKLGCSRSFFFRKYTV